MKRHHLRFAYKVFSIVVIVALLLGLVPVVSKAPLPGPMAPFTATSASAAEVNPLPVATASITVTPTTSSNVTSPDGKVSVLTFRQAPLAKTYA